MTQTIRRLVVAPLLASLLVSTPAYARTWHILNDGSGDAPTVQAGIDSASHGDVVLVGPGTYYEALNLRGKAVELRSAAGPEVTILDGSHADNSVITCDSGETNSTLITGFTITGGNGFPRTAYSRTGGGIRCYNACPMIIGNIIRVNSAIGEPFSSSRGGAMTFSSSCQSVVQNNIFEENTAGANGGAINIEGPCLIEQNLFRSNRTLRGDGGALYDLVATGVVILSNHFVANDAADHGGAIYVGRATTGPASAVRILQNVMIANTARGADGALDCSGGAIWLSGSGAVVHRNTIAFNAGSAPYADAAGGICLTYTNSDVLVEGNVIFRNYQGAVRTYGPTRGTVRRNLIFGNGRMDIGEAAGSALVVEENLFEDPQFCVLGAESRGELAWQSPALHTPYGILGAVQEGTCGDQVKTPAIPTTWGRIKALYR